MVIRRAVDPALHELCRRAHEATGSDAAREVPCICGASRGSAAACDALETLYQQRSQAKRLLEALRNFNLALFDVAATSVERYLKTHGWVETARTDTESEWQQAQSEHEWRVTVGLGIGHARPVDCLRDTLLTLETFEQRSRHEILAELLPDPDAIP